MNKYFENNLHSAGLSNLRTRSQVGYHTVVDEEWSIKHIHVSSDQISTLACGAQ